MKVLKYLSYLGKLAGFVAALDTLPFIDPKIGVVLFAAASLLKDTANRRAAREIRPISNGFPTN